MEYIGVIHKESGSDYGVSFPDFPGCITADRNMNKTKEMAAEALLLHITGMLDDGERLPKPSDLASVAEQASEPEDVVAYFFVPVELPKKKAVRVNTTFDEDLLAAIDAQAKKLGMTRSNFLATAAKELLD